MSLLLNLIGWTEIVMVGLIAAYGVWREEPVFSFVEVVMLAEWPLLSRAIAHDPVSGYYLWHSLNQLNIILSVVATYTMLRRDSRFKMTAALLAIQAGVKIAHYGAGNRVQGVRPVHGLFWASRILDLAINLVTIAAILCSVKETIDVRSESAPSAPTDAIA